LCVFSCFIRDTLSEAIICPLSVVFPPCLSGTGRSECWIDEVHNGMKGNVEEVIPRINVDELSTLPEAR
jgi:hypothetical protein